MANGGGGYGGGYDGGYGYPRQGGAMGGNMGSSFDQAFGTRMGVGQPMPQTGGQDPFVGSSSPWRGNTDLGYAPPTYQAPAPMPGTNSYVGSAGGGVTPPPMPGTGGLDPLLPPGTGGLDPGYKQPSPFGGTTSPVGFPEKQPPPFGGTTGPVGLPDWMRNGQGFNGFNGFNRG